MTQEEYVDHEVRIRVHTQQFGLLEKRIDTLESNLNSKLNWILSIIITAIVLPASLHLLKLI